MTLANYINDTNRITTSVGTFTKLGKHVCIVKYNGRTDVSVEEMKDFTSKAFILMDYNPFYVIADTINNYGGFSNDVWKFLAKDQKVNQYIKYTIVVSNNLGIRIQINFFLKFFKPSIKVTLVNSFDKAFKIVDKELEKLKQNQIKKDNKNNIILI